MALFDKVAELVVGQPGGKGVVIKDLRFSFNIEKTSTSTPNNSNIRIYNLNPDTRALVETPNNVLTLLAGYKQDIGSITIFSGIVTRSLTFREGPDWVTELELSDGLLAWRDSKFSASFAPGSSGIAVLTSVANNFFLPIRPLPVIKDKSYPSGKEFCMRVRDAMDQVCNFLGLEWSIQNQEVQILNKGKAVKQRAIVLSPDSGLIGSPEPEAKTMSEKKAGKEGVTADTSGVRVKKTEVGKTGKVRKTLEIQGYTARSLLQPTIQPGGYVQVKSNAIDGEFFRVEAVRHTGDTHAPSWETEMVLRFI